MKNKLIYVLLAYSFVVSIFLVKYEMIHSRNEEDKNFKYDWNLTNTTLELIHKATNKTVHKWQNLNFDYNFETAISFSRDGKSSTLSKDNNEDGFFEKLTFYNEKGDEIATEYDRNNDGIYERISYNLANGERLKLKYNDKAKAYELESFK